MAYEFKLPDIGEGVVEGEIVKWLVKEGDVVTEDQPLVEVMTDKATVTIPSPKKGRIVKRFGDEGGIAKVHAPLISIDVEGAAATPAPAATKPTTTAAPATTGEKPGVSAAELQGPNAPKPAPASLAENAKVLATPVTRRIAAEHKIDLREVEGSGPQGRVLKKDVLAVIEGGEAGTKPASSGPALLLPTLSIPASPPPAIAAQAADQRMPIRGLRKAIFKKMTQSEAFAVPFTYVDEVDVTVLSEMRERVNKALEKEGTKLTFLPFITKALIAALRKFPHLNALMDEEKQELVVRGAYNIGIGVATEAGLTVAVIHDADKKSVKGLGKELERLGKAARENKLTQSELTGGTFTITSLGKDGGMFATPVINHPEVAILGIHRIESRPVVVDRQIVIRERMYMSCSFDHRVIDGHVGAAFVGEVKRLLEEPALLFVESA